MLDNYISIVLSKNVFIEGKPLSERPSSLSSVGGNNIFYDFLELSTLKHAIKRWSFYWIIEKMIEIKDDKMEWIN